MADERLTSLATRFINPQWIRSLGRPDRAR